MKQKVDKAFVQNHFTYALWRYAALLIFATFGWSLIFSVTRYRPPPEKTLITYFITDVFIADKAEELTQEAYAEFPHLEEIGFYDNSLTTEEGMQKFMAVLAAGETDIYIVDKAYMNYFAGEGLAEPLDEYIESGVLRPKEDLTKYTFAPKPASQGLELDPTPHTYAIPTTNLYGLMENFYFDNRNSVMIAVTTGGNPDDAAAMIQWLYDRYYYEEAPPWVDNYDILVEQLKQQSLGF